MSLTSSESTATNEQPSNVRHKVVAVATMMSLLLYLDRFAVGIASEYIREDLRMTQSQIKYEENQVSHSKQSGESGPRQDVDCQHSPSPEPIRKPAGGDLAQGIGPEESTQKPAHLRLSHSQVFSDVFRGNANRESVEIQQQ